MTLCMDFLLATSGAGGAARHAIPDHVAEEYIDEGPAR